MAKARGVPLSRHRYRCQNIDNGSRRRSGLLIQWVSRSLYEREGPEVELAAAHDAGVPAHRLALPSWIWKNL